jgi:type I restriction enzyme, S subunit
MPPNWNEIRLGDITRIRRGASPRPIDNPRWFSDRGPGWVRISDVTRAKGRLLTKDGANTGNAAINTLDEEFSLLSSVALIRCRAQRSHPGFILNYLLSPTGQKRLKDLMSGNAITRLTLQKIKNFVIPLPLYQEQRRIAAQLDTLNDSIESYEREVRKLSELKAGLMTDLLTGRVRVPGEITVAS